MHYCKRCVMPSTRPGLSFDEEGICKACRWAERKPSIDWNARRNELQAVADWARRTSEGAWDCVIGVSGGKDSTWQALFVRDKLGLNPLLVQYVGSDGTELGRRNMENLVTLGFSLISVQPNPDVARRLARKSFLNFGNIVKYAEYALYSAPFRAAIDYGIPLVLFGENPALEAGDRNAGEHGWDATTIRHNNTLSGQGIDIWLGDGIDERDLNLYRLPTDEDLTAWGGKGIFMGFYLNWSVYENGVFAIRHGMECLKAEPHDIGNLYLHNSLDCDNSIVNSMLKHVKLGFGHATEFVSYDVRAGRMTRQEAIRVIKELDGRCHPRYVRAFCDWVGLSTAKFWDVANSYRGAMWTRNHDGEWRLTNPIWEQEPYDDAPPLQSIIERLDTRRVAFRPSAPVAR